MSETLGSKLLALKARSGLSLQQIARSGGYSGVSSIQRYFNADYDAEYLPSKLAKRLDAALAGYGDVTSYDIESLTETGFMLNRRSPAPFNLEPTPRLYVECYSSSSHFDEEMDLELFTSGGDVVSVFNKPQTLLYRSVQAMYVSSIGLVPRYNLGEIVFYEHGVPPAIGDFVIVFLADSDGPPYGTMGRYAGKTRDAIELETFNPPKLVTIPAARVDELVRILATAEILEKAGPAAIYAPSAT